MKHGLNDVYIMTNVMGDEVHFSAELMAWNSVWLIFLTIASLMVLVNRLNEDSLNNNIIKLLFGGLAIVSLGGLFYPIRLGLIGVNIVITIILLVDYFTHKKE